jgi:hypothetical protein
MGTSTEQPDIMKEASPQKEHNLLEKLVGDWTYEVEATMEPGKPPQKFTGTERVRSIGGLWFVAEGQSVGPSGHDATTILTIGYNPDTGRYVGTWVGSMMTHMWIYDGEMDASERVLSLYTDGPSFTEKGKTAKYKEVIEFKSNDERTFTSHLRDESGNWEQFMASTYRRRR